MSELELNEQEQSYLRMILTYELGNKNIGKTDEKIIKGIYKKLKKLEK